MERETNKSSKEGEEMMKRTIEHEKELVRQIDELIKDKDVDAILDLIKRNKDVERMNKK